MSRRLGTMTSRTKSEHDGIEFEEDCSLSAFTVDKCETNMALQRSQIALQTEELYGNQSGLRYNSI
jgi:hypothetical protein